MYKITEKVALNPTVTKMVIEAPLIAKKAKPGQFIIVRPFEDSERIPLTVAGYDREAGTVEIIFQIVGGTTMELNSLNVGDSVHDFVGPLGRATEVEGLKKVCVVGGGVGCAIALPIAKELHDQGCVVHSVIGFRSKDLLILEDEFKACSDELRIMTDDGSYGTKGVVTATQLNIRESAATTATQKGSYSYGDRITILETSNGWGRTDKGWVSLNYVYQDGTTGTKTAKGLVTGTTLNVRSGPGTNYDIVGSYSQGDSVEIYAQFTINNTVWGCTNKGWVSMDYVEVG